MRLMMKTWLLPLSLALAVFAAGCATNRQLALPDPVRAPKPEPALQDGQVLAGGEEARQSIGLTRTTTPTPPGAAAAASGTNVVERQPPLKGQAINANIEGMPVPAFINEFFGSILGVGFQMAPAVARMNDLVTLRTSGPQSPQAFYRLATRILQTYGVSTTYENGIVLFEAGQKGEMFQAPFVLSGRASPEVPMSHRPVFQLVELGTVRIADVNQWLTTAFANSGLQIQPDLNRNAIVLFGKPDVVSQAVSAIRVLDRPFMRGRMSARLEPGFITADELAKRLVDVLNAEGYGATLHGGVTSLQAASVIVLPIAPANTVIVFAGEREALEHAVEWARNIDQPNPTAGDDSLFYYTVRNTRAQDIVDTLSGIRGGASTRAGTRDASSLLQPPTPVNTTAAAPVPAAAPAAGGALGSIAAGQLLLDAPRNALIFQGKSSDWGRMLPLIKQMDKAPRQVMIEITIAEITLGKTEEFGVNWLAKANADRFGGSLHSGKLDTGIGSGLTYILDVAGQARATLRAYADADRVSVLSTPRLMVKSGEEASFDVGTEIPTLSSTTASAQQTEGTSNILQSIQYRKTGIILNIKPVVYSDNRVDLDIRQEVSDVVKVSADDAVQSPSIFNRAISTSLSLRDGSAVLLGGLMSNRGSAGNSGVPYLKDVPVLGGLFRSNNRTDEKTELVLMIVPYIIESDEQATSLSRAIGERFQLLDLPMVEPQVPVTPSLPVQPPSTQPLR
ncbi:type II secretion system protein GspD [Thermomonas brevis]